MWGWGGENISSRHRLSLFAFKEVWEELFHVLWTQVTHRAILILQKRFVFSVGSTAHPRRLLSSNHHHSSPSIFTTLPNMASGIHCRQSSSHIAKCTSCKSWKLIPARYQSSFSGGGTSWKIVLIATTPPLSAILLKVTAWRNGRAFSQGNLRQPFL